MAKEPLHLDFSDAETQRNRLSEAQAKSIRDLYREASKEVGRWAERAPRVPSDALRKEYLNRLQGEINRELKGIERQLDGTVRNNMTEVVQATVGDAKAFAQNFGLSIQGAYSHVPTDIVRAVASGQLYEGNWTLSRALWLNTVETQRDVQSIVAKGILENKSAYDIAKDLEKYVNPDARKDWDWSKVYPGTRKVIDYNAQRLARTMVSHAYQQAFVRTTQKNPFITKYEWRASDSERTCQLCLDRDGQYFAKDDLPLDHPNGMCTYLAVIEDDFNAIADRLADWAHGGEDPALDEWAKDLYGKDWEGIKDAIKPSETTNKEGTDWAQIPTTLTQESKNLLKRYTDGWYDIPNEMAKMIRNGGTLEDFARTRVSPTGYTQEQAEARFRSPFEAVQNILNTIAHSKEFDTLTRIETHDSVPALESVLSWGLRSTSQVKNFEDRALLGKIRGMEFLGDSSMPTLVYKIQNAPGLDISKYSSYKAQKEVLVSGDFRVVRIDEPEQIGDHKSTTVWLEYLNR